LGPKGNPLEIIHATVALPELILDRNPRHEGGLGRLNAMQTLGEPGVDVQRHRVMRQADHRSLVNRYRVLHEAFEVGPYNTA